MHGCTFISNHNSTVLAFVEHCYTLINNSKWNKLIIYVRTSHDCVLIIQPSSNFADRFFSFICWHLLHLGFGAFGMLQVPQEIRFSLAQKLLHLLSLCPIIQTAVNNFVTVFTSFGSDVGNSCSKNEENKGHSLYLIRPCRCGTSSHHCQCCDCWPFVQNKRGEIMQFLSLSEISTDEKLGLIFSIR